MKTEILLNLQSATVRGIRREVFTLRQAPRRVFAVEHGPLDWYLLADAGGYMRLAELMTVAATQPGAFLYVPPSSDRPQVNFYGSRAGGMLFVNHIDRFRAGDWRELRRRLGPPRPVTRATRYRPDPRDDGYRRRGPDTDPLDIFSQADTLIVSASAENYRRLAGEFLGMATMGDGGHIHFQDACVMRQAGADVIAFGCTRWEEPADPEIRYDYRWIYPGRDPFAGIGAKECIRRLAEDGWEFVRSKGSEYSFRRVVG